MKYKFNQRSAVALIENKQARLIKALGRLSLLAEMHRHDEHALEMIGDCVEVLQREADDLIAIRQETDNEILLKFFGLLQRKRRLADTV